MSVRSPRGRPPSITKQLVLFHLQSHYGSCYICCIWRIVFSVLQQNSVSPFNRHEKKIYCQFYICPSLLHWGESFEISKSPLLSFVHLQIFQPSDDDKNSEGMNHDSTLISHNYKNCEMSSFILSLIMETLHYF